MIGVSFLGLSALGNAEEDRASGATPGAFVLHVEAPEPAFSNGQDGTLKVTAPGYGPYVTEPGQPNLPVKTYRVAIPNDGEPTLSFVLGSRETYPGRIPEPHPRFFERGGRAGSRLRRNLDARELDGDEALRRQAEYRQDPRIYQGSRLWPEAPVWLGQIGNLRYQRFVEVHVAPYRWDPVAEELVVHRQIEIQVDFNRPAGARSTTTATRDSAVFERLYREAFVNGDEAAAFRVLPDDRPASTAGRSMFPGARRKILIRADGMVRLDHTRMMGSGFLVEPINTWQLESRGVTIPLDTNDDGDGLLEPGEWVQFYGQALDEEPDAELNLDIANTDVDLYEARDFGDENVYFLTVATSALPLMAADDGTPNLGLTPPTAFRATVHEEVDSEFGYRPLGSADPWYWLPTLSTEATLPSERTDTVALPGLASPMSDLDVRVRIRGITEDFGVDPDHNTRLTVLNSGAQVLQSDQQSFDGRTIFDHEFTWVYPGMGNALTDPVDVKLEVLPVATIRNDAILNEIDLTYDRTFSPIGGFIEFTWIDEEQDFAIDGLSDATPEIIEITTLDGDEIILARRIDNATVSGAGPYSVRFNIQNRPDVTDGAERRFIVFEDSATTIPGDPDFFDDVVSDLRDNTTQADYIVIAADDVLDDTPGMPLDLLLNWRGTAAGGDLSSKIARYSDVVDEFNHGLQGPDAIESFLRWVMSTAPGEGWANPKPSYVLLLGDGSFNYKGGPAQGNVLPTQIVFKDVFELGYYASDNLLAAVIGNDSIPDLMVGRIPARSTVIANRVLQKVLDYEQSPAMGSWKKHIVTISDQGKPGNNPGEALQFETLNSDSLSHLQGQPYTNVDLRYWTDYIEPGVGNANNVMRADIMAEVNGSGMIADGAALVQFVGHGNFMVWSDAAFFDERDPAFDTLDLMNGLRLPFVLAHNCLTGGFHIPVENTLGEGWLKREGGGGIGVLAPSSLSFVFVGVFATESIWDGAFGLAKKRALGEISLGVSLNLCGLGPGTVDSCQAYVLQGDPATRLALPDVAPPTDLIATGGNAQVQLDWTASTDGSVTYDVYRATLLSGLGSGYTKLNMAPLMGLQFIDSTAVNAQEYFYYVIAVDPQSFESRASNLNSDCGGAEMDCVRVTPLNPGPPSVPSGVTVTDPGTGSLLFLDWNANPETDLDFYTLHWGVASGDYPNVVQLDDTTTTLPGLQVGQDYFFAVTATNTSGNTSDFSDEVTDFPVFSEGLRSPRFVDDLHVDVSGSDLELTWSEVTTTIYGKPLVVERYDIFRGPAPGYGNGQMAKLDECLAPCTSYPDLGAFVAVENWQYRVQAVSSDGNTGGLGADLPDWVDLSLGKTLTPGELVLVWPAVTTTTTGQPTTIAEYEIYVGDTPVTRLDIRDGVVVPFATTSDTMFELMPPSQNRFYSVLAVDTLGNRSPF